MGSFAPQSFRNGRWPVWPGPQSRAIGFAYADEFAQVRERMAGCWTLPCVRYRAGGGGNYVKTDSYRTGNVPSPLKVRALLMLHACILRTGEGDNGCPLNLHRRSIDWSIVRKVSSRASEEMQLSY
jgi:hypothetical protein